MSKSSVYPNFCNFNQEKHWEAAFAKQGHISHQIIKHSGHMIFRPYCTSFCPKEPFTHEMFQMKGDNHYIKMSLQYRNFLLFNRVAFPRRWHGQISKLSNNVLIFPTGSYWEVPGSYFVRASHSTEEHLLTSFTIHIG